MEFCFVPYQRQIPCCRQSSAITVCTVIFTAVFVASQEILPSPLLPVLNVLPRNAELPVCPLTSGDMVQFSKTCFYPLIFMANSYLSL